MSSRAAQHPYGHPIAALPQALRLARCQSQHILQQLVDEVPSEDDVVNQPITRDEERILTLNASVVASLEDLFSWRCVLRLAAVYLRSIVLIVARTL